MIELLFLFVLSITTINARCTFYDHRKLREEVKAAYYGDSRCEDHPSLWNVSVRFFFSIRIHTHISSIKSTFIGGDFVRKRVREFRLVLPRFE